MRLDFDHATGAHCGSTSLRGLATYYGWGLTESTCFGLGEGLGFSYLELPESPHRAMFGRTGWLERAFFENYGISHTVHEGDPFEIAWESIKRRVDDDDPVMIFTDLYYLDYYETETHFAPHSLLVVGYDDTGETEQVHLADSEFEPIQTLPVNRLEKALTSTHVVPLQCRYLTVDDPQTTVDFETAATAAIESTVATMLGTEGSNRQSSYFTGQGVAEIERFAADIPEWGELPDPSWTARFAYQNIERRGTGGGAFRRLYADFLTTAEKRISVPPDTAAEMAEISRDWTVLGNVLREASETENDEQFNSKLTAASEQAGAVASHERKLYERLGSHAK